MECWNTGILGIKAQIYYSNCQKILQAHRSITPLFHYSNWGEAPGFKAKHVSLLLQFENKTLSNEYGS
jgi:hypothetical protein